MWSEKSKQKQGMKNSDHLFKTLIGLVMFWMTKNLHQHICAVVTFIFNSISKTLKLSQINLSQKRTSHETCVIAHLYGVQKSYSCSQLTHCHFNYSSVTYSVDPLLLFPLTEADFYKCCANIPSGQWKKKKVFSWNGEQTPLSAF